MNIIFIQVAFLLLPLSSHCHRSLGKACFSNFDCHSENTECRPFAPGVCQKFGLFCQCATGYRQWLGSCKKEIPFGGMCNSTESVCVEGEGIYCKWITNYHASYCGCEEGYEPEDASPPKKCVRKYVGSSRTYGKPCSFSGQCNNEQVCSPSNICSCPFGYQYKSSFDSCSPISLNDACRTNADCYNLGPLSSWCHPVNKTCQCAERFHPIDVTFKESTLTVCHRKYVANQQEIHGVGQPCNEDPFKGPLTYCVSPSLCTSCTPQGPLSFCLESNSTFSDWTTRLPPTTTRAVVTMSKKALATTTTRNLLHDSQLLNEICRLDEDCSVLYSVCDNKTETCQCRQGFDPIGDDNCRQRRFWLKIGEFCDPRYDTCVVEKTVCANETCQCRHGLKPGPRGDDCIEMSQVGKSGDPCEDSSQCYYDLTCLDGACRCFPGYKEVQDFRCAMRTLFDACPNGDSDCRFVGHSSCRRGACHCNWGYKAEYPEYDHAHCVLREDPEVQGRTRCDEDIDCWYPPAPSFSYCDLTYELCVCNSSDRQYDANLNSCESRPVIVPDKQCFYREDCDDVRFPDCYGYRCVAPIGRPALLSSNLANHLNFNAQSNLTMNLIVLGLLCFYF